MHKTSLFYFAISAIFLWGRAFGADPISIPNLISYWDFHEVAGQDRVAKGPFAYRLKEMGGPVETAGRTPYGEASVRLKQDQWFSIPRGEFQALDIHGPGAQVTVVAWVKRESSSPWQAVAGVWNETDGQRQYCLFLNATSRTDSRTMKREKCRDLVHGHVSDVGGNTANNQACITYSTNPVPVPVGQWQMVAMTYDGNQSYAFVDGKLTQDEGRNPLPLPNGLFHGNADFTVGAVHRHGVIGNFLNGTLGGLAIYSRALTEAELTLLAQPQKTE